MDYSKEVRYNTPIPNIKCNRTKTITVYPDEKEHDAVERYYGKIDKDWYYIFEGYINFQPGHFYKKINLKKNNKNIKLRFRYKTHPSVILSLKKLIQKIPIRI